MKAKPRQSKFHSFLNNVRNRVITSIVPPHLRRAIFNCSLAAKLIPSTPQQYPELAKTLVKDLDLVCAANAMLAPMSWNNRIWEELPELHLTPETQGKALMQAANVVLMNTPTSLRYASPRVMIQDTINTLHTVLRMQPLLLRAA